MQKSLALRAILGSEQSNKYKLFELPFKNALACAVVQLDAKEKKFEVAMSWTNPEADRVIARNHKNGTQERRSALRSPPPSPGRSTFAEGSMNELTGAGGIDQQLQTLLGSLRALIRDARARAMRAVDVIQVQTCWQIGQHIVEFEQGGAARATYGQRLLPGLATALTAEFGKGFDASNLRYMRLFYQAFPIRDALRHELSWTHYRTLLRVDGEAARQWYMREAVTQNWSTRALERQIGTLYYERLLASQDRAAVEAEAGAKLATLDNSPREFVRDPVLLEFLGLPNAGELLESELEQAQARTG
jgi:hypothetical protein